jgi:sec-independent protein translocase protein TatC
MTIAGDKSGPGRRIVIYASAAGIFSCLAFWKASDILAFLMVHPVDHLVFFSPAEAFIGHLKIALFTGLVLAVPAALFRLRKPLFAAMSMAAGFFAAGAAFSFYVLLSPALKFLINFGGPEVMPVISISGYLSFVISLLVISGAALAIPAAFFSLSRSGMMKPEFLNGKRKHAILIILILSAALNPTADVLTLAVTAAPLAAIYEISILICRLTNGKERQ